MMDVFWDDEKFQWNSLLMNSFNFPSILFLHIQPSTSSIDQHPLWNIGVFAVATVTAVARRLLRQGSPVDPDVRLENWLSSGMNDSARTSL